MSEDLESHFEGSQFVVESGNDTEIFDGQFLVAVLLVSVAKADGKIAQEESDRMLQLISDHFKLRSAESLELLRRAMVGIAENPDLDDLLSELGRSLSDDDRGEIALMMVKVIAADGKVAADAMDRMRQASKLIGVDEHIMHDAYERYFTETQKHTLTED